MSEKTEKATPKKIKDARKKGQVAQSQDINKLLTCIVLLEAMLLLMDYGLENMEALLIFPMELISQPFEDALPQLTGRSILLILTVVLISSIITIVSKVLGSWFQFGFLFAPGALKFDFNRINPVSQAKNFFSGQRLTDVFGSIIKAILIVIVTFFIIKSFLSVLLLMPLISLDAAIYLAADLFAKIERFLILLLLVLSVFDFSLKRYFHLKGLKMDKTEVKKEFKDSDGDPLIKGKRRMLAMELLQESTPREAPPLSAADVVIVNPTHFAVALYYDKDSIALPIVIAKGEDNHAREIIQEAFKEKIPVIRFIWLARTLYKLDEGSPISRETLKLVAAIYKLLREIDTNGEVIEFPKKLEL